MAIYVRVGPITQTMDMVDAFELIRRATHISREVLHMRPATTYGEPKAYEVRYVMDFDDATSAAVTMNASERFGFDVFEHIVALREELGSAHTREDI